MKKNTAWKKLALGVLLLAAAAGVWMLLNPRSAVLSYTTEYAAVKDIKTFYTYSGSVENASWKEQLATGAGTVKEWKAAEGSKVKEGDVVVTMKSGAWIKAPMDGTVTNQYALEGEEVERGDQLFTVADLSEPTLTLNVDEYDIAAVRKGAAVQVKVLANGAQLTGTVKQISKRGAVDNQVTYYPVTIALPENGQLMTGMTCEAYLPKDDVKDAVVVSAKAVQYDMSGNPYLMVVDGDGKTARRTVSVGVTDGVSVQILSGISAGDAVAVYAGAPNAQNMMQMRRSMGR